MDTHTLPADLTPTEITDGITYIIKSTACRQLAVVFRDPNPKTAHARKKTIAEALGGLPQKPIPLETYGFLFPWDFSGVDGNAERVRQLLKDAGIEPLCFLFPNRMDAQLAAIKKLPRP